MITNNDRTVFYILKDFKSLVDSQSFVEVRGQKTVEMLNVAIKFDTAGDGIINVPGFSTKEAYVDAEIEWYNSASTKADFITDFASMWGNISDDRNFVNSNYGYLIYSPQNCYQYDNAKAALENDPQSRRAVMVYCPNHIHYTGGNDYVCTMYVSYMIRDNKLHAFVNMRSSDIRFGLIGADLAWQVHVLKQLAKDLNIEPGFVHWHADSLHLYERHFKNLENLPCTFY